MNALLARISNPIVWRSRHHAARKLFEFSLAEHGSMLDLFAAARLTSSADRRAAYLRHALDERRHAAMFAAKSAEMRRDSGRESLGFPNADTDRLFERLGEQRFLAFVHRGETRGRRQFEVYRDWFADRADKRNRAFFDGIIRDEIRHESYTNALLSELAGGERERRAELRIVAGWEAWRTWRRAGRFLAERIYYASMVALYVLLAPFALFVGGVRPVRVGWCSPPAVCQPSHSSLRTAPQE